MISLVGRTGSPLIPISSCDIYRAITRHHLWQIHRVCALVSSLECAVILLMYVVLNWLFFGVVVVDGCAQQSLTTLTSRSFSSNRSCNVFDGFAQQSVTTLTSGAFLSKSFDRVHSSSRFSVLLSISSFRAVCCVPCSWTRPRMA